MIVPSKQLLSQSSAETHLCTQIIPNNYVIGKLDENMQQALKDIESKFEDMEKASIEEESGLDRQCFEQLKKEFKEFSAKLESGNFSFLMKYDKQKPGFVTPPHHKLKFRRMSTEAQKLVGEKFRAIWDTPVSADVIESLRKSTFDCFAVGPEEMLNLLQHMYLEFDLPNKFNFDVETLRNFLFQVYKNYNDVPFHNFRHAFCVTQMMYAMLVKAKLREMLNDLNILVLITASICHDLDHPGLNNFYQIHARTELALRYNDVSPLENHHCSTAFRILELEDCNIFSGLSPDEYNLVRDGMIGCILATDMSCHNKIFNNFENLVGKGFTFAEKEHVTLIMNVLIKVADISNEARPLSISEPWLDLLLKEFHTQSEEEKRLGLPVTPFMDPEQVTKPASQVLFIGYTLVPLFEALGTLLPALVDLVVVPARAALAHYRIVNDAESVHRKSIVPPIPGDSGPSTSAAARNAFWPIITDKKKKRKETDPESAHNIMLEAGAPIRSKQKMSSANGNGGQRSSSRSPDFRRMMDRVRSFAGRNRSVGSAGKTDETASADDEPGPSNRSPRPPGWMCGFLQNIRKKSPSSSAKGNPPNNNEENQKKEPDGKI